MSGASIYDWDMCVVAHGNGGDKTMYAAVLYLESDSNRGEVYVLQN